jgi:hypothetical protein
MGNQDSKLEDMMAYGGATKYQLRVAENIHRIWQETQPVTADGKRRPRYKTVRGAEPGESSKEVDIANTPFADLPEVYKSTNMNSARVVVSEILRHVKTRDMKHSKQLDLDFVEMAAHFTHQQYIIEHQHSSDTEALIPYYLLPPKEKTLLRKFIRTGISLYDPDEDRLDNTLFPPRALVVVRLPPLVDDERPELAKAWETDSDSAGERGETKADDGVRSSWAPPLCFPACAVVQAPVFARSLPPRLPCPRTRVEWK